MTAPDEDVQVYDGILRSDTPAERATRRGHVVQWDPPFGVSSVERWTCSACGHAVLRYRGNVYGSALDADCAMQVSGGDEE